MGVYSDGDIFGWGYIRMGLFSEEYGISDYIVMFYHIYECGAIRNTKSVI